MARKSACRPGASNCWRASRPWRHCSTRARAARSTRTAWPRRPVNWLIRTRRHRQRYWPSCAPMAARLPPSACARASATPPTSARSRPRRNKARISTRWPPARWPSSAPWKRRPLAVSTISSPPTAPAPCARTPDLAQNAPMLTFYNELHSQHRGRFEMFRGTLVPCFETPERADMVVAELGRRNLGRIVTPHGVPLTSLERIHTPRYLHFLRHAWHDWLALDPDNANKDALPSVWPVRTLRSDIEPDDFTAKLGLYSMDNGTPLTAGTWTAAKTGADCAVNAAHALRVGERSTFALTPPPGHHAGPDYFGGGCYLNNAALAAQHLLDDGLQRVAILDLDYHHGSGTQAIFYERADVLCLSIHAEPRSAYPFYCGHADETGGGAGLGYNANLVLPAGAPNAHAWFTALETACVRLSMYRPDALVVALDANTFLGEAHGGFGLQGGDYLRLGERLAWLNLPTCFVFEGGSALRELGTNIVNVLEGFETAL